MPRAGRARPACPAFFPAREVCDRMPQRLCVLTLPLFFAVLPLGCRGGVADEKDRRYPVRVTVALDGKPLADGQIDFVPLDGRAPAVGSIKDGQAQFGSVAGKCRVEILAFRKFGNMREPENYLPKRYHENSQLSVEVSPGGENTFTFKVTSK
jgi:hypothetical protein